MSSKKTRKSEDRDRSRSVSGVASRPTNDSNTPGAFSASDVNPGAPSATPWFYHMAYRQYWDHWRHVQTWLKAAEYAKRRAEVDKNKTLRQLQNNGTSYDPPGGFATVMPNATYPPPSSSFFDLAGRSCYIACSLLNYDTGVTSSIRLC